MHVKSITSTVRETFGQKKCSFLNKENVGKLLNIMEGGRAYTILEATANLLMLSLWRGPLWDIMKNDNGVFSLSKEMPIILFFIFCVLFYSQYKKVIQLVRNNGPWNYGNIRQAIFVSVLEVSDVPHLSCNTCDSQL